MSDIIIGMMIAVFILAIGFNIGRDAGYKDAVRDMMKAGRLKESK